MSEVIVAAVIAFLAVCAIGPKLIPYLKKIKFGQSILEEGPRWHMSKAGTPTMGGIAMVAGVVVALLIVGLIYKINTVMIGAMFFYFALIGFIDDYIKVVKKQNLGLRGWQKLILQVIGAVIITLYAANHPSIGTNVYVPFYNDVVDFGGFYYPFTLIAIVGVVNAVNLTDGLDGLAASVSAVVFLFFTIASLIFGYRQTSVVSAAALGACLGFLLFNRYPAKVFMGDTGALALGGAVGLIAVVSRLQLYIFLAGIIYVVEALSVVLQVGYYKYTRIKTGTGKRIFRMAPLHHHFELGGLSENKIVLIFVGITFVFSLVALFTLPIL